MNKCITNVIISSTLITGTIYSMDTVLIPTLNYAQRRLDPQSYATKASNKSWTEKLAEETSKRPISDLNKLTIAHDGKDHPYNTDMIKRSTDKETAIIQVLVGQSLEENPSKQNPELLQNLLSINHWLVPDLHYLLALKALEAQNKTTVTHCGDAKVDVLLHKIAQLSLEQKKLLQSHLTLPDTSAQQLEKTSASSSTQQ